MADGIVQYIISLVDRTGGASQSATDNANKMTVGFDTAKNAALGVTAAIGTFVAAGTAMAVLTQEVADFRNDIGDAATRSGIAADTLQGLQVAAEGAGLQFGSLLSGLDQFGARLSQAATGGNRTADAFETLGVAVTDAQGNLRDGDSVLRETLGALNEMEPSAARSALAVETLGRSGGRLLQALSGSELEDFVALAEEFGVDVGPEAAKSAGEWQRAIAELDLIVRGLKSAFVDAFGFSADAVFALTDALAFLGAKLQVYVDSWPALVGSAGAAVDSFGRFVAAAFDLIQSRANAVGLVIGSLAAAIGDVGSQLLEALQAGDIRGFAEAAAGIGEAVTQGLADGLELASDRIEQSERRYAAAVKARDDSITQAVSVSDAIVAGAQATAVDRLLELRRLRQAVMSSSNQQGQDGGGDGGGGGSEDAAKKAAEASSRVFASGFEEDRRRLSDVLAEGARNLTESAEQTAIAAADTQARMLRSIGSGAQAGGRLLQGDLGGALTQAGGMASAAGLSGAAAALGPAGAIVSGLQMVGNMGAEGVRDALDGLTDTLVAALEALPEILGSVLPQFAVSLVAELIPALIAAGPEILKSLIIDLPQAIGDAIAKALGLSREQREQVQETAGFIESLTSVFGGASTAEMSADEQERQLREGSSRSRSAARTATDGQRAVARESDRLATLSTRPRRGRNPVRQNPYDQQARQWDAQFGEYGRNKSTVIGPRT